MTGVLAANVAYTIIGVGVAGALGAFDRRPATFVDGLIGLPLGMALMLLFSGYAALLGVTLGPTAVSLLAVVAIAATVVRLRRRPLELSRGRESIGRAERVLSVVLAVVIGWVLVVAGRTMTAKPVAEWDGWVLWATKARVLYEHPGDGASILQSSFYGAPSYPLGLPALQATTLRAVGSFDGVLLDLQLWALVVAALAGIWALLRHVAHPLVIGLALLGTLASSQLAYQLTTNYADVPLAFLTALGVVAGAVWLAEPKERRPWQLACFTVFLAAAAWTKNEGLIFAAAAAATLVAATLATRSGTRAALAATGCLVALVAPWRIYTAANDLRTYDYNLADFLDLPLLRQRADRIVPSARELIEEMTVLDSWGLSLAVIALALLTALLTSRRVAGLYAAGWLLLSFCGLVATYWISNHSLENDLENSSFRTIVTLLVTGLCLTPLLLAPAADGTAAAIRAALSRRRDGPAQRGAS